jgi:hypothetical protein
VHTLDRPDAAREVEDLRFGERRRRVPAAVGLPDHRRVEALLDRRPDGERRREVVPVHDQVGAVADADLVDAGEEVVGGVPSEHVGEARLHPDPDQREPAGCGPVVGDRELLVAEFDADLRVRPVRVRPGQ